MALEVNTSAPISRPDLSYGMNRANNVEFTFTTQNYFLNRKPDFVVHMYNIAEQEYKVSRPPLIRIMTIPARKRGERFAYVTSLPSPVIELKPNVDSGESDVVPLDARRLATDIVNPENTGIDQNIVVDSRKVISQGNNLSVRGVFWSLIGPEEAKTGQNAQFEKDYDAALKRLEKHYNFILEEAKSVEVSSPGDLSKYLRPEHHAAADYYGLEFSWHGKRSRPMDCPNCGTRVKEGIAFHVVDGELCVIDWERTVKAGKRTREQAFEATGDPKFAPATKAQTTQKPNQIPEV